MGCSQCFLSAHPCCHCLLLLDECQQRSGRSPLGTERMSCGVVMCGWKHELLGVGVTCGRSAC